MFHFPALPPAALCIQAEATAHDDGRVSPFGNPRITARLPAPRGLSQAPTSFIGSWCQDIHRMLLETWLNYTQTEPCDKVRNRCSRSLCSSQDTDGTTRTQPPSGDLSARPCENSNSAFTRRDYLACSGKIRAFIKENTRACGCFLRTQQRARQLDFRLLLVPLLSRGRERTSRMAARRTTE
jgi:hypothetical protein